MIPPLDLFHQLFHEEDGYTAILAVTLEVVQAIANALGMTVDIVDTRLADLAPLKTLT